MKSHKFLVITPAWLGDCVMMQGLLKTLKQKYPKSIIDLIAPSWARALLTRMPEVHHCLYVDFIHGQFQWKKRLAIGRQLRSTPYDQAFILPNTFKSALIPCIAEIPIRTGWRGEMRYFLLNDIRLLSKRRYPLMLQRYVALAYPHAARLPEQLPYPSLSYHLEQAKVTAEIYKLEKDISKRKILLIAPGAAYGPSKCWPAEYFARVIHHQISIKQQTVWLVGNIQDKTTSTEIMHLIPPELKQQVHDLVGQTSLDQVIDLISLSDYVISHDSGLMHLAAALGKKQLAIFGSTSPHHTPPLNTKAKTLWLGLKCSPCFKRICPLKHHDCMRLLQPEKVVEELNKLADL